MRIAGLFVILTLLLVACGSNDETLPTQLNLPAPTKTLIPTQSQSLTTPTLPDNVTPDAETTAVASADTPTDIPVNSDAENTASTTTDTQTTVDTDNSPTDTPVSCNVQEGWFEYTIQRGDNLASIANRTGSTIDELSVANCLENPNRLNVGQLLLVPNDPSPESTGIPTSAPSTSASPQATSVQIDRTPIISASLKKTYESPKGFGFEYPVDWFITESQTPTVDNVLITSFEYTSGVEIPQNLWTDEMVSITVTIFQEETTQSLSDWTQTVTNQFQDAANVSEVFLPETVETQTGIQGRLIDYVTSDDTVVRNYYFIVNGTQIQINVGGNVELAETVINTLALTQQ